MSTQDPGTPSQPPPATPGQPPPTTPAQAQPPATGQTTVVPPNPDYPVKLDIAYDSASTRADVLLRFITVIPPLLYGWLMSFVFLFRWIQVWFTVLTTGKVPRDAFDFMVQFLRWAAWLNAYMYVATDKVPPFSLDDDPNSPITYEIPYTEDVPNWRALIPWWGSFVATVALYFILIGAYIMSIVTWFTIVMNDRRPADQHRFMVIALRWMARVGAFQSLLTNARPPLVWQ